MESEESRCRVRGGGGWQCPFDALPGRSTCSKHYLMLKEKKKKREERSKNNTGEEQSLQKNKKKQSEGSSNNNTCEEQSTMKQKHVKVVKNTNVHISLSKPISSGSIINLDEDDDLIELFGGYEKKDGGHSIDPCVIKYISQKVEDLREAMNGRIQAKASSLHDKLSKKFQKSKLNHCASKPHVVGMKAATRYELPFFQRDLDRTKFEYTLSVIKSYIRQPSKHLNAIISNIGMFPLRRKDLLTLSPTGWLSAGVIGSYARLIMETSKSLSTVIVSHFLYSEDVIRCESNCRIQFEDIFRGDFIGSNAAQAKILIPVNLCDLHWGLVMIDMHRFTITVLDSKFCSKEVTEKYKEALEVIAIHLSQASSALIKGTDVGKQWTIKNCPEDLPKQSNDWDCGIFVLAYMECIARGIPYSFAMDVSKSRLVICSDILDYILTGD